MYTVHCTVQVHGTQPALPPLLHPVRLVDVIWDEPDCINPHNSLSIKVQNNSDLEANQTRECQLIQFYHTRIFKNIMMFKVNVEGKGKNETSSLGNGQVMWSYIVQPPVRVCHVQYTMQPPLRVCLPRRCSGCLGKPCCLNKEFRDKPLYLYIFEMMRKNQLSVLHCRDLF